MLSAHREVVLEPDADALAAEGEGLAGVRQPVVERVERRQDLRSETHRVGPEFASWPSILNGNPY